MILLTDWSVITGEPVQQTPKWRRNPEQRPRQIAQAALVVFGKVGVGKATLDEIAERAGVSKGTIYLYFPTKEELFRQTIRDALSSSIDETDPAAHTTATRQLLDAVARHWKFLNSETAATVNRLVSAEQSQFPELAELYATNVVIRFEGELRQIIDRGINAGEFRETDPAVAARMFTALTMQRASWANGGFVALGGESSEAVLSDLTEFCLRAIAPDEAAFAQADGAPVPRRGLNN